MTEYLDTILVECDRSSAKIKDDENPGMWVNGQNNTLQLLPNDKVSVYSSYINDVGSGQTAPIEFRGKSIGETTQTVVVPSQFQASHTHWSLTRKTKYTTYTTDELTTETYSLNDNIVKPVINFYKTMDGKNYFQCPRRFIRRTDELENNPDAKGGPKAQWDIADTTEVPPDGVFVATHLDTGRCFQDSPTHAIGDRIPENYYGYVPDDMRPFLNYQGGAMYPVGEPHHWILKNDASRYTIMKKLNNVNPNQAGLEWNEGLVNDARRAKPTFTHHPPYYARDPEYFQYVIDREQIELSTDEGFSSASNIAEKLTNQLTKTVIDEREDFPSKKVNAAEVHLDFVLNKHITSKTYKPLRVGCETLQDETNYKRALFNGPTTSEADVYQAAGLGVSLESYVDPVDGLAYYRVAKAADVASSYYYNGYRYIACKRPEIYEKGSILNDIFGLQLKEHHKEDNNLTHGMNIDIPYYETDTGLPDGTILTPLQPSKKLLEYKAFLESQEKYPELFSKETIYKLLPPADNPYYNNGTGTTYININNARFSHMNTQINDDHTPYANCDIQHQDRNRFVDPGDEESFPKPEFVKLGNSYYDYCGTNKRPGDPNVSFNRFRIGPTLPAIANRKYQSSPFFFHYDPDSRDTFYENPVNETQWGSANFSYGCFGKAELTNTVIIYPAALNYNKVSKKVEIAEIGLPLTYYHTFPEGGLNISMILRHTKLGFDRHWTAWGTAAICLQSGRGILGYGNTTITTGAGAPGPPPVPGTQTITPGSLPGVSGSGLANPDATFPIYGGFGYTADALTASNQLLSNYYNNSLYIGADSPKLDYDGSFFSLKDLHTALNKGNLEQDSELTAEEEAAGGDIVYKINPTQDYETYSPVQYPYNKASEYYTAGSVEKKLLTRMNFNLEPLTVYDTSTGIMIEDFGLTEETWEQGVWGRLGFSYDQFHSAVSSRITRITQNNIQSLNVVTTNAKIDSVDTKSWTQNQFGHTKYDGSTLINYVIPVQIAPEDTQNITNTELIRWFPPINQSGTKSISIPAVNYPISMFNGYYSIRSDIAGDSSFVGGSGNTRLPVVSVINKQNPVGDFYISPETDIEFTITKPTRVSSIKIEITEPDGTPAPVSLRSSVIFKIQRERILNTDLAKEVFERLRAETGE